MNINEIPEGFELVEEEVETTAPIDTFNEDIDPLLTDEEEVETNEVPEGFELVVEEEIEEPVYSEKEIKEANIWVTPPMIQAANKKLKWNEDISEDNYDAWVGDNADGKVVEAWDLYKSENLGIEKQPSQEAITIEGLSEATLEDIAPIINREYESGDLKIDTFVDYLTEQSSKIEEAQDKDFENLLGKSVEKFATTDKDGKKVYDIPEDKIDEFNAIVEKYRDSNNNINTNWRKAGMIIDKYNELAEAAGETSGDKTPVIDKEYLNAGLQVELYDKDTDEVIDVYDYNEIKSTYIDQVKAKGGTPKIKDVDDYVKRWNANLRYRVKSGGVKSRNTRMRIATKQGPGAMLEEFELVTKKEDWTKDQRTKYFKGIDKDRNLKYWKNLLENDASNIMFTKKASGGKAMLSNFLPDGYSMVESGKTPWSDWVTITHDATGEKVKIGFDYKETKVDKIEEQRTNLITFLSEHSTRGQMQVGFEKSLSNYQIFEKASKLKDIEGGINVDYRKEQAYNRYSSKENPNLFNPIITKAPRTALGAVSNIDGELLEYGDLAFRESIGQAGFTTAGLEEKPVLVKYNRLAVSAQEEALQILIDQKRNEGVKNQETPELNIGLNFGDSRMSKYTSQSKLYEASKGLNITQQEVDDLAREILGNKNWQKIQKDAFENWVEKDKSWGEEIKDQMGMLWKTTVQQSESFKKARLATAYLQHTTDILSQYIDPDLEDDIDETDPRKMLYSNMFKEWKEDESIDYAPTIKPGQGYYVVDGRKIPSYIIDGMRNEEINLNLAFKNYEDAKMYSDFSIDKMEDFSEKIAIYTANYNDAENAGTSFVLGTVGIVLDIAHGIYKLKTLPEDLAWAYNGVNNLDVIDRAMDTFHSHVDTEKSQFARTDFGGWYDADGNFQPLTFGSYWMQTGAEQAPIYLAMIGANAIVPGGGFASELAIGLTAGLSTYSTADYNMRQEKNIDGTAKYSSWEVWYKSLLSMANETVLTTVMGGNLLKRSNKILKGNQPVFKKFYEGNLDYIVKQIPEAIKGVVSEGTEEFIINTNNNLIMGNPLLQGGLETFTVGSVMGGTMVITPSLYNMVQTNFTHGKDLNLMRENNDALGDIYNENNILKEKIIELKYRKFNENKEEKQLTQKLIDDYTLIIDNNSTIEAELIDANETVLLEVQENLVTKGFSNDAFNSFQISTAGLLNVDNQIKDIEKSDMDEKSKKQLLNILQLKFNGIRSNLEKFKSKKLWGHGYYSLLASSFFNKKNKEKIGEIRGEATTRILDKKGSEHDISPEELDQESATIYMEQEVEKQLKIDKKGNKDLKSVKTKEEGIIEITNYYDNLIEIAEKENDLKQKEKLEEQKDDAVEAIKSGSVNGVYLKTGNIKDYTLNETFLAIEENMVANESKMAGAHEIGHGWSVRAMAKDPKQFNEFGEVLSKYLQKTHAEVWELMQVENTNLYNEDGTLDYEEVMSSFFEQIGKNKIKINPKGIWAGLMGDILNKGLKTSAGKTIPFKGQMDIINYLYGVGKSITDGTLTLETPVDPFKRLEVDKDGTEISEVSKTDITPKVSKSESRARKKINRDRKQVGEQINELAGDIQNANELATNLYNEILNPESTSSSARMIDNIIDNQLRINGIDVAAGNVYNKPIKEFRNEVKDQLLDKTIMRFDPKKAVKKDGVYDPGGFIVSELVNYRIGDVLKKYKPKAGEVSIDAPLESGKTREFVDESIDIEGAIDEKPTVTPRSKIKKQAPDLVTQELEDLVETAVLEIEAGVRPDVDDKVYKSFIQEVLEGKLTNEIKDRFGKGAEYDNFIKKFAPVLKKSMPPQFFVKIEGQIKPEDRQFTFPPKRLTTQAEIDKATRSDQVYLENTAQGVNMYKLKDFSSRDLANFLLPPLVNPKTGKKSGRKGTIKTSVAKSVGVELGKDMIPSVMEGLGKSQKEIAIASVKAQRQPTIKFHKSGMQNMVRKMGIEPLTIKGGKKVYSLYDFTGKDKDKNKTIELSDKEAFKKWIIEVIPRYLPIEFITKSSLVGYGSKAKSFYFTSDEVTQIKKEAAKNQKEFTPEERAAIKEMVSGLGDYKSGIWANIKYLVGTAEYKKRVDLNYKGLGIVFNKFQDMIAANPNSVKFIVGMLETGSQSSSHWLRNAAMPRGYDRLVGAKWSGETHVKEHVWPQNMFAEFMLGVAIKGASKGNINIDKVMPFVKDNYFQMLITLKDDNKLKDTLGKYGIKYNLQAVPPKEFLDSLQEAFKTGDLTKAKSIWTRYVNSLVNNNDGGFNLNNLIFDGKSVASIFNVDVSKEYRNNSKVIELQNKLIEAQLLGQDVKPKKVMYFFTRDLATPEENALKERKKEIDKNKVISKLSQSANGNNVNRESQILDKALQIARDPNAPVKKIRVFDFDDTLARTKSKVLYTMPDGKTGKITPAEFAKRGNEMEAEGATWDFSEFEKVIKGKKGPLFVVAKKIQEARGTEDVFILTARPQEAAGPIKEFLESIGLNIPINNITGLSDSSPLAKSGWIVNKAAEGYNDFYFADDHMANVNAVKKVLDVIDVKGKVQQAKIKFSKSIDQKFNEIIENKTGIESFKEFSPAKARVRGKNIGKFKFFVPPSADDFVGLLYHMLGKGKEGDSQMAWFKENLLDPYARAMADITRDRTQMIADFKALKKNLKDIPKNLRKEAFDGYTYENVVRIYAWNKQGESIPGLSKADLAKVEDFMAKNPELQMFADQLIDITKDGGYNKPTDSWLSGTITTDLMSVLNNNKRKIYLKQWQDNVDLIFSDKNLNKLEAAFGSNYREALENMLHRMKTGSNRGNTGADRIANRFLDYVNNSVGIVMFFNMRSALLQTISAVNFINWSDNNMLAAGKAFANQPQFWKDFMTLMNSDFLVDRRQGLKINVSESEIADAAATSKNKAKGVVAYLLKKGFLPTQFADSFAIASGGATFYRNRVNKYVKEGMSQEEAEVRAFNDFREIAEESQQSSRPDRISQQQAGPLGRLILSFQNTPMQYTRLIKKATLDLVNGRGDWKSNVSRIVYYAAIQNVIFNALQSALFALAWGEEDDEDKEGMSLKEKKTYGVLNSMLDSVLRGAGIAGGILSVLKNMSFEIYERSGRKRPEYSEVAYRLLDISPPIDIKISKLKQAANNYEYNEDLIESKGFAIDNPAWLSIGLVVAATTNVPLDRLILKMNNVKYALDSNDDTWKKVAALLGYQEWQLRTEAEQELYKKSRKVEKAEHKSLKKWEVIDGDEIESLSKREQTNILKEIGLKDDEIKELKYEADRVNKILEEYDKDKKKITKILDKRGKDKKLTKEDIEYNKIEDQTKAEQVKTLTGYGLTKQEIRDLKYEDDRIKKILELQED